jgi:hypothetical protein
MNMDENLRKKAGKTAVDGFIVVERIYRHSYQVLTALKDDIKRQYNFLKEESAMRSSSQSTSDPESWIYQFRGIYLANEKFSLEEYKKKEKPILFIQASLYNPTNAQEPILRYGVIEKIFNMKPWKGVHFDDYFRMTLAQIHETPKSGRVRASHCEASVVFDETLLLDIKEDKDVVSLAKVIGEKYIKFLTP